MKSAFALALPFVMSAGLAGAAVDPALLALMPADASALFGMEVQHVAASPFRRLSAVATSRRNEGSGSPGVADRFRLP